MQTEQTHPLNCYHLPLSRGWARCFDLLRPYDLAADLISCTRSAPRPVSDRQIFGCRQRSRIPSQPLPLATPGTNKGTIISVRWFRIVSRIRYHWRLSTARIYRAVNCISCWRITGESSALAPASRHQSCRCVFTRWLPISFEPSESNCSKHSTINGNIWAF